MTSRDTFVTREGELVSAHIGPIHLDRTDRGLQLTLVGAVRPTTHLSDEQIAHLSQALSHIRR